MTNKPSAPRELYATYYKSSLGESLVRTNTEPTLIKMNPDTDFEIKFVEASAYLAALEKCKAMEGELERLKWSTDVGYNKGYDDSKEYATKEITELKAENEKLKFKVDWYEDNGNARYCTEKYAQLSLENRTKIDNLMKALLECNNGL